MNYDDFIEESKKKFIKFFSMINEKDIKKKHILI